MTVLLTGASGLLGSNIKKILIKEKINFVGISNKKKILN